jgi:hypothetical protein
MRPAGLLIVLALSIAHPTLAADSEARTPYQLRVVVRTADHPTLTPHFRAEVRKALAGSMEAALAPAGTVEVIDFNTTPAESHDAVLKAVSESGLDALKSGATGGPKTHFVFIDFVDGKYEIRTRQHDGSTGFVTPFVRRTVHPDRGFVGRLAGLAVAQDFAAVGSFETPAVGATTVSVQLRAGDLAPMDAWVKKGEVFAIVHLQQTGRASPRTAKGKKEVTAPAVTGTEIKGMLLQVVDGPRSGVCTCKLYNRYRGGLTPDAFTVGYRAVKLGTGEARLRLRLTDGDSGVPFRADVVQPRAGTQDYPDAARDNEEMTFADGIFTSKEPFKHLAFVSVRSADALIARIPVAVFEGQVASQPVDPRKAKVSDAQAAAQDMRERVRTALVMQARCFEEIGTLQTKDKPKALQYGEAAYDSLNKESLALRAELTRLRDRHKSDAPTGMFEASEGEIRNLENYTKKLLGYLGELREAIKRDNDPTVVAARKTLQQLILDADLLVERFEFEQAIAKYEEAQRAAATEPAARDEVEKRLEKVRKLWGPAKDAEHTEARKFVFEVWPKLEKPADVKEQLPAARRALEKCKAVADRGALLKMQATAPGVSQRYEEALKAVVTEAGDDPDKKTELESYLKVTQELEKLLADLGRAAAEAPK